MPTRHVLHGVIMSTCEGFTYVGGVGDHLTQEDLLVAVKCVDDQAHQLRDLGLEGEGFCLFSHVSDV